MKKLISPLDHFTTEPILFNLEIESQREDFEIFKKEESLGWEWHDTLDLQLKELYKISFPSAVLQKPTFEEFLHNLLDNSPLDAYGYWVAYPWSKRVVRLVSEKDFFWLRTSRNQYKITSEEQQILSTKTIGVIGLSVGQSIALTLTMERVYGEIRLADFDTLDLSNMNRIRTGIHQLGMPKTTIAAREIKEIDPFLKVICFPYGITEENIDSFLYGDKPLDLLIEECDSVDVKILARERARFHGIPVVMDTSDKGLVDVERFDTEKDRPLLHGLIPPVDPKVLKGMSSLEKIPYLLPMVGADRMSTRLKASALEVGVTLTTWPQLASSVVLGGALTTDVSRRILLGQSSSSGRYYVDMESLVAPSVKLQTKEALYETYTWEELSQVVLEFTNLSIIEKGEPISINELNQVIEAVTKVDSYFNMQPWRFIWFNDSLFVFSAFKNDHNIYVRRKDIGSAIFSIEDSAEKLGINSDLKIINNPYPLIAQITFKRSAGYSTYNGLQINQNIEIINLKSNLPIIVGPTFLAYHLLETDKQFADFQSLQDKFGARYVRNLQTYRALFEHELNFGNEKIQNFTGINTSKLNLSSFQYAMLSMVRDREVVEWLNQWEKGAALERLFSTQPNEKQSIIAFSSKEKDFDSLNVGIEIQKVNSAIQKAGWKMEPINFINYYIQKIQSKTEWNVEQKEEEIVPLIQKLKDIFGLGLADPLFVCRIFPTNESPELEPRHQIQTIFTIGIHTS